MANDYVINPDRFKNFFNELDTRRTLLTAVTDLNNKLFTHFNLLEETLTNKSRILDTQIEKFKEDTEKTLESLRIREGIIPETEVTLAARVLLLKDSGIADIREGSYDPKGRTMSDLLRMWFRRMDCKGMMNYLLANRRKFAELRVETAMAADEAVDLLGFVLEVVEEFVDLKVTGKKVDGFATKRCACGILIHAAFPIPSGGEPLRFPADGGGGVSRRWKERAAAVLEKWKGVLSCYGDDGVSSGEAIMFLTMVIGFGLKDRFEDEFLRGLVLEVGSRRDMGKITPKLFSGDKIRDMIEELVKTGKEIDAVYIASEAGLNDAFPAVKLLKSSLESCRKTGSSREDVNNKLNTTRMLIKCIEDHKLESEFMMSDLRKWVAQLEKMKVDNKSGGGSTSKPSSKKRRHPYHHRSGGGAATSSSFRPLKSSSSFQHRNRPSPYGHSSPRVFENGLTSYTQSPAGYIQYASHLAQDIRAGAGAGAGAGAAQGGGSYDYIAPAAPYIPAYPTAYNQ